VNNFFLGLDLGQAQDYTALAVLERLETVTGEKTLSFRFKHKQGGRPIIPDPWENNNHPWSGITLRTQEVDATANLYHLRHLERLKLGTSYPAIVERVKSLLESEQLKGKAALVVDKTGVGAPVVDMFKAAGLRPVPITITGGNTVTRDDDGGYHVPKRDLVSVLQVLFQAGRLKVAAELPAARLLVEELLNFRVKINVKTAHDSYEAWREGVHDDLVLAVALACWYEESS